MCIHIYIYIYINTYTYIYNTHVAFHVILYCVLLYPSILSYYYCYILFCIPYFFVVYFKKYYISYFTIEMPPTLYCSRQGDVKSHTLPNDSLDIARGDRRHEFRV